MAGSVAMPAFLLCRETAPQLAGMKTIATAKKPIRKREVRRKTEKSKLPPFMEISPISGLAVAKARPGAKPITSAEVRALLADFP